MTEEDRSGIADSHTDLFRIASHDLKMLRRETIDERDSFSELRHLDHGAEIAPARASDIRARQS